VQVDCLHHILVHHRSDVVHRIFTLVKEHLTDDGVMVVNVNMRGNSEGSINQYLADKRLKMTLSDKPKSKKQKYYS
jgi:ribosome maturation factor RimP